MITIFPFEGKSNTQSRERLPKNNQNDKSVTSEKQDEKIAHNAFDPPDSVSILPQPSLEVERQEHNIQPDDNNVTEVVPESGIQILDIASNNPAQKNVVIFNDVWKVETQKK